MVIHKTLLELTKGVITADKKSVFLGEAKLSLCLVNKASRQEDMGEWRYSSTILELDTRWR
jgi:hypothetical protein